jgi:hypothetical protein
MWILRAPDKPLVKNDVTFNPVKLQFIGPGTPSRKEKAPTEEFDRSSPLDNVFTLKVERAFN